MALTANNARLTWTGYEFGIGPPDDDTATICGSLEEASLKAKADDSLIVKFRSLYVSEWFEALPEWSS